MNARIEKYLKAYNLVQFVGWLLALLILPVNFILSFYIIYGVQLLSLLEIFHAYRKWTHSSPLLCFLQIGARLMILYFVLALSIKFFIPIHHLFFTNDKVETIAHIMFIAWCTAEIIRYAYYLTELYQMKHDGLLWLRYTAFIICYPVGLICELYILTNVFVATPLLLLKILIILIFTGYAIAFPRLYLHLLKQRKQKLSFSKY